MVYYAMLHGAEGISMNIEHLQREISSLAGAFTYIPDHVVITDDEGRILFANKGVEDATGFSRAEVIGKTPGALWGGHMDKQFYEDMWQKIKIDKKPFYGEVQNRRKDGMIYWQQLRIFPIFGDIGDVRFLIGIEPDVALRRAFEDHLRQYISGYVKETDWLYDELERKNAIIEELKDEITVLRKMTR